MASKYFESTGYDSSTEEEENTKGSDESSEEEWEAVDDASVEPDLENYKPAVPSEGVQITLSMPELRKNKRKKLDANDIIRQELNRARKKLQETMHKTHFLCSIAYGLYLSNIAKKDLVLGLLLSHTTELEENVKQISLSFISRFFGWYRRKFELIENSVQEKSLVDLTVDSLKNLQVTSEAAYIAIFASIVRVVFKVDVRVCIAFDLVPIKPKELILSEKQLEQRKRKRNGTGSFPNKTKKSNVKKSRESRKVLSSEDDDDDIVVETASISQTSSKDEKSILHWVEIYSTTEKRWIPLDLINGTLDEAEKIEKATVDPLLYVFAFENTDHIKDVTQRYCSKWTNASLHKLRVDQPWLQESLLPFRPVGHSKREIEEDRQLSIKLSLRPLPTTLTEYKNHPLYCLKRHLLKFEVIYPPDSIPVGYFRSEPVYDRNCVQTVHSSLYWKRQARVVKENESPYKVSTARPKWDKNSKQYLRDLPLELYGIWQTEPYVPPEAKGGKVPRNEYGNVELFQPSMLPKGTVHLQLPGLIRIANKLGIDCAPAVVAFDVHSGGGGTHPVMDGFVVCQEYRDVLIAAWDEEEENISKRGKERKIKKIYDNWKRLIKGAMIKARLEQKFK